MPTSPYSSRQGRLFDADDYAGPLFAKQARRALVDPSRHEQIISELTNAARDTGHPAHDVLTAVAVAVLVYRVYLEEKTARLIAEFEGHQSSDPLNLFDNSNWNTNDSSWDLSHWVIEENPYLPDLSSLIAELSRKVWSPPSGELLHVVEEPVQRLHPALLRRAFHYVYDLTGGREDELTSPDGAIAEFFETAIDRITGNASRFGVGEYFTPRPLLDLLVRLVDPRPGEKVYDPCFGSGGFLAAAARYANLRHRASRPLHVAGTDINAKMLPISYARVVLAGADPTGLQHRDAFDPSGDWYLDHRTGLYDRFDEQPGLHDCLLAAPPFGGRVPHEVRGRFPVRARSSELLFLQLAMELLRPGGRAAVIVPESLLHKSGGAQQVRERLLHEFRMDAVLELPHDTYTASSVRANVLVFSRREPARDVWFVSGKLLDFANNTTREGAAAQAVLADGVAVRRGDKPSHMLHHRAEVAVNAISSHGRKVSTHDDDWVKDLMSSDTDNPRRLVEYFTATSIASTLGPDDPSSQAAWKNSTLSWITPVHRLAERNYELVVKPSGEEGLDELFDLLRNTGALEEASIVSMDEVFEVFGGANYRKADLAPLEDLDSPNTPPFIRIRDLDGGRIELPEVILSPAALEDINPRLRLQHKDLLVSTKGTVGKVAQVSDLFVDAVPATGLAVLRPQESSGIEVSYLASLLYTAPYQAWLQGHARGSVIQNLTLQSLRRLPIPLLPLAAQRRVAAYAKPNASVAQLGLLFSQADVSPVTTFIEGNEYVDAFLAAMTGGDTEQRVVQARHLRKELKGEVDHTLREWLTMDRAEEVLINSCLSVLDPLRDYADALEHFDGTERFSLLSSAQVALAVIPVIEIEATDEATAPDLSSEENIRNEFRRRAAVRFGELIRSFRQAISDARETLLASSSVDVTLEPAVVEVANRVEGQLRVRNTSPLPLRQIKVRLMDDLASLLVEAVGDDIDQILPALAPAAETFYRVALPATEAGKHQLTVEVQALRFDQKPFVEKKNAPYEVHSIRQSTTASREDLGPSPYILGSEPVRDPAMFYGRQQELSRIYDYVNRPGQANIVILEGTRRSGKSSVLRYLERDPQHRMPGWVAAYCSFQSARGKRAEHQAERGIPTEQVFRTIALRIALAMHGESVEPDFPDTKPYTGDPKYFRRHARKAVEQLFAEAGPQSFDVLQELLAVWLDQLGNRRLLLLLDEFDKIDEGIRNGITGPEVPENLRSLFQEESRLNAILAVFPRIVSLRQSYWSVLFGLGKTVPLRPLDIDEATALITEPVKGRLVYEADAAEHLAELAGRHPFILQLLADQVFGLCKQTEQRTVTRRIVDEAARTLIKDNEHFEAVWNEIQLDRRRAILALLNRLSRRGAFTSLKAIEAELEARSLRLPRTESLGADHLDALREMELVQRDSHKDGSTTYRLAIPLMGEWIERHDLEDLFERARLEAS